ncbi:MAG TPA: hypothetical protein VGA56_10115 [Opitutaceae bacterium]
MNTDEAKFVLRAYRPGDDRRGANPIFKEALDQAHRDPALLKWLGLEQAFDRAVSTRIEEIRPPAGIRDAILIGSWASQTKRRWWRSPVLFVVAAAFVAAVTLPLVFQSRETAPGVAIATAGDLARFALENLDHGPHSHVEAPGVAALETALARLSGGLVGTSSIDLSPAAVSAAGCQSFAVPGGRVFEICFSRNGAWFHLYVARGSHASPADPQSDVSPLETIEASGITAAAWRYAGNLYTLATRSGADVLRPLL